ncbi:MAG: FmdE family protein [Thermodesulfobacteriota bacterium]
MTGHDTTGYPEEFQRCIRFHGHVCPGLGIGYAAAKAAAHLLRLASAQDEEVVAVVENDSCAVDAIQVILGCTFGKGNLVFRDWGKQVYTFFDRAGGRGVRLCFRQETMPLRDERHMLQTRVESGEATHEDTSRLERLRVQAIHDLVSGDPCRFFQMGDPRMDMPQGSVRVSTSPCAICGETTVTSRLVEKDGRRICRECGSSIRVPACSEE